jgi:hypothetical protein
MFKLVNTETKPLTPELAKEFFNLEASPTERLIDPKRVNHLREKAEAGQLVTFHWSTATLGNRKMRMNGQHSSKMLTELNGQFPQDLVVHIDNYTVDTPDGLALLFRQFDDRKSSRSVLDVSGAYQGLFDTLSGTPREEAKLAIDGHCWYQKEIEGLPVPNGEDKYGLFATPALHGFIIWVGTVLSKKTPELKKAPIVAAMYGTFSKNEMEAKTFWDDVARGGVKFEDQAPATVLDGWLKSLVENKGKGQKQDLKAGNYYQGCIYAWNAFREKRGLSRITYDTKKGLWQPLE